MLPITRHALDLDDVCPRLRIATVGCALRFHTADLMEQTGFMVVANRTMEGVTKGITVVTTKTSIFLAALEDKQLALKRHVLLRDHSAKRTLFLDVPLIPRNPFVHLPSTPKRFLASNQT